VLLDIKKAKIDKLRSLILRKELESLAQSNKSEDNPKSKID
jgi:hypothetical protein